MASAPARRTSQPVDPPTTNPDAYRGALRRGSLRFLDDRLERQYQRQGGAESLTGFRISTGVAAVMWLLAAIVVPIGTPIPADRAVPVGSAMALLNSAAFLLSTRADTLDRQHSIVSVLTSANGLVILWLASTGGVLPGYGISAIMLLFAFGFVARTGFVFAAWRSAVIVVGFVVAALLYPRQSSLLVDVFIFAAAVIGTLLALRLLEPSRRRVFYQDIVITHQADALKLEKDRADELLVNVLPGIDLLAPPRRRADDRRCVSGRHRALCRHRRVHAVGCPTARRRSGRVAGSTLRALRRARGRTRTREDQDHRRCVHGRWRPARAAR